MKLSSLFANVLRIVTVMGMVRVAVLMMRMARVMVMLMAVIMMMMAVIMMMMLLNVVEKFFLYS